MSERPQSHAKCANGKPKRKTFGSKCLSIIGLSQAEHSGADDSGGDMKKWPPFEVKYLGKVRTFKNENCAELLTSIDL